MEAQPRTSFLTKNDDIMLYVDIIQKSWLMGSIVESDFARKMRIGSRNYILLIRLLKGASTYLVSPGIIRIPIYQPVQ
jgi:hypothetical protein